MPTKSSAIQLITPGAQVVVRDEDWLVRSVSDTTADGRMVRVTGLSELVQDTEATFFTAIDDIEPVRPEDTTLVVDESGGYRRSRLWLEAVLRKAPVPVSDSRLTVSQQQLLADLRYQRVPVHKALEALRPRLLIADAVGLGETLGVGMILSELIRRGRGERILVVTPRAILEQFQHEMWTRFSIGLVRLDSEGIQKVRQKIPPTRNPFTYFKRVIVSIDTLKQAGRYRHQLENVTWDAVVIDEVHNLINSSSQRNTLARVLAPRTDALILASATPHNGKAESFAELSASSTLRRFPTPRPTSANRCSISTCSGSRKMCRLKSVPTLPTVCHPSRLGSRPANPRKQSSPTSPITGLPKERPYVRTVCSRGRS